MAERVAGALAPSLGREAADELVRDALADGRLAQAAGEHLAAEEVARLLDPAGYLGAAPTFIDRALKAHRKGSA
jgi:3-carboxy-cis,cis-muconate cycloisomerase